MDLILSAGCSFEMGLGLNFYRWEKNNIIDGNPYVNNNQYMELLSQGDRKYMEKNNYTGLVAKYLNCDVRSTNNFGCGNDDIMLWCVKKTDYICKVKHLYNVKLFLIGLTDPFRDFESMSFNHMTEKLEEVCEILGIDMFDMSSMIGLTPKKSLQLYDEYCQWFSKKLMSTFVDFLRTKLDCPLLVWSWHKELQKSVPKQNRILFENNGNYFQNLSDLEKYVPSFQIRDDIKGIDDEHPSLKGHKIIAENIIRCYNENFT